MSRPRNGEPRLAALGSWAVLAASFTLSAATWVAIGRAAGFDGADYTQATDPARPLSDPGLSDALPVAVDGYLVVALVLWMAPVPERVARFARANTYAAALVGIVAQSAFHALTVHTAAPAQPWRAWLAGAVGALPPALAALAVHMRALIVRESRPRAAAVRGTAGVPAAVTAVPGPDQGVPAVVPGRCEPVPTAVVTVPAVPEGDAASDRHGDADHDRREAAVSGTPSSETGTGASGTAPSRPGRDVPAGAPATDRVDVADPWQEFDRGTAADGEDADDPWRYAQPLAAPATVDAGYGAPEQVSDDPPTGADATGTIEASAGQTLRVGMADAEIVADMRATGPYSIRAARTRYGIGQDRASRLITEAAAPGTRPETDVPVPGTAPASSTAVPEPGHRVPAVPAAVEPAPGVPDPLGAAYPPVPDPVYPTPINGRAVPGATLPTRT